MKGRKEKDEGRVQRKDERDGGRRKWESKGGRDKGNKEKKLDLDFPLLWYLVSRVFHVTSQGPRTTTALWKRVLVLTHKHKDLKPNSQHPRKMLVMAVPNSSHESIDKWILSSLASLVKTASFRFSEKMPQETEEDSNILPCYMHVNT